MTKIYLGQDPDPDVFKRQIRIRTEIVQIRNTDIKYSNHTGSWAN
jgi:hypothetical protein